MCSGTVRQFVFLAYMPKNPTHLKKKIKKNEGCKREKRLTSLLNSSNLAFSPTKQWSRKFEMLFLCVFQGGYFFFFLKTNKQAHRVCLRKNNNTTLQKGGMLTQRHRFRSEYSLLLQHDLKRNLIMKNLSHLHDLLRGRWCDLANHFLAV